MSGPPQECVVDSSGIYRCLACGLEEPTWLLCSPDLKVCPECLGIHRIAKRFNRQRAVAHLPVSDSDVELPSSSDDVVQSAQGQNEYDYGYELVRARRGPIHDLAHENLRQRANEDLNRMAFEAFEEGAEEDLDQEADMDFDRLAEEYFQRVAIEEDHGNIEDLGQMTDDDMDLMADEDFDGGVDDNFDQSAHDEMDQLINEAFANEILARRANDAARRRANNGMNQLINEALVQRANEAEDGRANEPLGQRANEALDVRANEAFDQEANEFMGQGANNDMDQLFNEALRQRANEENEMTVINLAPGALGYATVELMTRYWRPRVMRADEDPVRVHKEFYDNFMAIPNHDRIYYLSVFDRMCQKYFRTNDG